MGWKEGFSGESFRKNWERLLPDERLDCGLAVAGYSFDLFEKDSSPTMSEGENALVCFLFRLLKKLQEMGTVPAVDWSAYAATLSKD
jgi:hypothetical protein